MTNKEIARAFRELGDLMELHNENPFKVRSYQNAYLTLRKLAALIPEMPEEELKNIKGVGDAIAGKIKELLETGQMATLENFRAKTPEGVREMLDIQGFGPKKVADVWKSLGVETVGELLYACNENRLIELKGFGEKTQNELKKSLQYHLRTRDKFLYAAAEAEAENLFAELKKQLPGAQIEPAGAYRRKTPVLDKIECLIGSEDKSNILKIKDLEIQETGDFFVKAKLESGFAVVLHFCKPEEFGSKWFRFSASDEFMKAFLEAFPSTDFKNLKDENAIFEKAGLQFIPAEMRENNRSIELAKKNSIPQLLEIQDLKGIVHNHSTYSDGLHTLREMAEFTRSQGFEYLVISDHSKSAFYANGLKEDRVRQQWEEIVSLNSELAPFKIFKSIESDILNDGSLDYPDELLKGFDLVIASVHSNLKMDLDKATNRVLKAVENPFTAILGHPTGRLLLSREGYPLDHCKIIDACAANGVSIELNANPYRLDLDWSWIPYAIEKGVLISINPDAHSKEGILDIKWGTYAARKGGLSKANCLNTKSLEEFENWLQTRRI